MLRRFDRAELTLDLYEFLDPTDGRVPLLRGDCRVQQGRLAEAATLFREAARRDENRIGIEARRRLKEIGYDARG